MINKIAPGAAVRTPKSNEAKDGVSELTGGSLPAGAAKPPVTKKDAQ